MSYHLKKRKKWKFKFFAGAGTSGPEPRVMKPMTKEEWEKQQSVVRRVYDPETGRTR